MKNTYPAFALSFALLLVVGCAREHTPVKRLDPATHIAVGLSVEESDEFPTRGTPVSSQAGMTDFGLFWGSMLWATARRSPRSPSRALRSTP